MALILVAEDEEPIRRLIEANLRLVGHQPLAAADGREALALCQSRRPDLVLLDVMLPFIDGFAVKQQLDPNLPVIFVTAKASLSDRLDGLGLGADDYIAKPFEMLELLARVETVLRRCQKSQQVYQLGALRVEFATRQAYAQGREVPLTPQEFNLLEALVRNRNLALSRDKLLELAWGYDFEGDWRTVDAHIQKLRKKLHLEDRIQTVYKFGYRFSDRETTR